MSRFGVTWLLMVLMFGGFIFLLSPPCTAYGQCDGFLETANTWYPNTTFCRQYGDYTNYTKTNFKNIPYVYYDVPYCTKMWTNLTGGNRLIFDIIRNDWNCAIRTEYHYMAATGAAPVPVLSASHVAADWSYTMATYNASVINLTFQNGTTISWDTFTIPMTVTEYNNTIGTKTLRHCAFNTFGSNCTNLNVTVDDPYSHPVCGYTNYQLGNNSIVPATLSVDDNSTLAESYSWNIAQSDYGDLFYTTNKNVSYFVEIPGMYIISHVAINGTYHDDCQDIVTFARQNDTEPQINITKNITSPNWTPAIPTVPVTIPTIPDAINRTTARGAVNGTILGPYAAAYMDYWDTIDEGLISFINDVVDVILFPLTYATDQLSLPTTWLTEIALQYSEKSNNIVGIMIQSIYAFPPKLANLVTYGLLLDLILVVMHEVGEKK